MSTINVYQQRPGNDVKAESPLHHADLSSLVGKGRKNAGVTLREHKFLGHLTLRGDGRDPAFAGGVFKALGLELPVALTVVANGEMSLQWLGPDEWLLIVAGGQEFAVEQKLRDALEGGLTSGRSNERRLVDDLAASRLDERSLQANEARHGKHGANQRPHPTGSAAGRASSKAPRVHRRRGRRSRGWAERLNHGHVPTVSRALGAVGRTQE